MALFAMAIIACCFMSFSSHPKLTFYFLSECFWPHVTRVLLFHPTRPLSSHLSTSQRQEQVSLELVQSAETRAPKTNKIRVPCLMNMLIVNFGALVLALGLRPSCFVFTGSSELCAIFIGFTHRPYIKFSKPFCVQFLCE